MLTLVLTAIDKYLDMNLKASKTSPEKHENEITKKASDKDDEAHALGSKALVVRC